MGAEPIDPASLLERSGWVRGLVRSLVADSGAAEDVVQETWIAALSRAGEGASPPRRWLERVARNFALQRARSEGSRRHRERASARDEALPSAAELVLRLERQQLVVDALARLAEPYRSTVILRYVEDLEPIEIARRGGLPPGTVRRRLKEGLDRLRRDLDGRFDGDRATWVAALLPLAKDIQPLAPLGAGTALTGGMLAMKTWMIGAAALLAATALLFLLDGNGDGRPGDDVGRPGAVVELSAADAAGRAIGELDEVETPDRVAPNAAGERTVEIAGTVRIPRGSPEDPTLEVLLLREAGAYGEIARRLDRGDGATADLLAARGPVDAAGRFRLAPPSGEGARHLLLRGRHLYLAHTRLLTEPETEIELVPEVGAWIVGRLVVPAGVPESSAAGAKIEFDARAGLEPEADSARSGFRSAMRSDAQGHFEIRAVPLGFGYALVAVPESLAAARAEVGRLAPFERREVVIALGPGGRIAGRVIGPDGGPVGGAEVSAAIAGRLLGFDDRAVRSSTTDAEGRFRLDGVAMGEIALRARKPGLLESERTRVELPERAAVDGVVLRLATGNRIAGILRGPGGEAAPGIEVRASFDTAWRSGESTLRELRGAEGAAASDSGGRFAVTGLGEGPFTLSAESKEGRRARLDGVRPGLDGIELVLHPPLAIAGRVQDERGSPQASFRIVAAREVEGPEGPVAIEAREASFESPDGRFALESLSAGSWLVSAEGAGFTTARPARVELPGPAEIVLTTARSSSVAGTVLDPEGLPRASALVRAVSEEGAPGSRTRLAVADSQGRFRIEDLGAATVSVVAEAAACAPSEPAVVDLRPGEAVEGLALALRQGGTIEGEVFDEAGRPGAGRFVHVAHGQSGAARVTHADAEGRFRLERLPPGSFTVMAVDPSIAVGGSVPGDALLPHVDVVSVDLADGETERVALGTSAPESVLVHGTVTQGGRPYANAWIMFLRPDGGGISSMAFAQIDEHGRYEAEVRGPGLYNVDVARYPGRSGDQNTIEHLRTIPAVDRYALDLALPDGKIAGRAVLESGAPAAGARVTIFADGRELPGEYSSGIYADLVAREDGRFEVPSLRGGRYRIGGGGPARGARGKAASYAHGSIVTIDLRDGESRDDVVLRLPEAAVARVHVVDAEGRPVRGATVFARGEDGEAVDPLSAITTDAAGMADVDGLALRKSYSFLAVEGDRASAESAPSETGEAAGEPVRLTLGPGARVRVRLEDGRGRPVQGWASLLDERGHDAGSLYPASDLLELLAAGAFSPTGPIFGPVPPGSYAVEAEAPGGSPIRSSLAVHGQPEIEIVMRVLD